MRIIQCSRIVCLALVGLLWLGAVAARADRFVVEPGTPGGTNSGAYDNWTIAATQIQWAVNAATADETVLVSNGVYTTTNGVMTGDAAKRPAVVAITNANIILKSVNGPLNTIIDAGGTSAVPPHIGVFISSGGTIDGFTVRNGYSTNAAAVWFGAGISLYNPGGGAVTNCIVHNNRNIYAHGGGIGATASLTNKINNCQIYSNTVLQAGGGVYGNWATVSLNNSVIWGNRTYAPAGYAGVAGGGVGMNQSTFTMRNCLIYSNVCAIGENNLGGGGVAIMGANYAKIIDNCTITGNTASNKAGGVYISGNDQVCLRNSIIYGNFATNVSAYPDVYTTNTSPTNCCFGDTNGIPNWNVSGNITNNPLFVDAAGYNYRLTPKSPCINTGTNQSWMTNAVDLDGAARIRYERVDMGAYEKIYEGTIYRFY